MVFVKHRGISFNYSLNISFNIASLHWNSTHLLFDPGYIVIIYVDNILIHGKNDEVIDTFIKKMQSEDITLNKEGMAEAYFGVDIQRNGVKITPS